MDRYLRHIQLDGFGEEAQRRLAEAKVLVVGAGALGTVAALYLGASGTGHITIADFDTIDITNLQRQLSYSEADVGRPKAETLASKIRAANSTIKVDSITRKLTPDNLPDVIKGCDIVMECSDNPSTKYAVTSACESAGIPYVLGGIAQYRGQVMAWQKGCPTYREIFPEESAYLSAAQGGVLATAPGIIGSMQATEAIKILASVGEPLFSRLLMVDTLAPSFMIIEL